MQLSALLPVLALLGSTAALTQHPRAEQAARQLNPRRHHQRQVERMTHAVTRRNALAAEQPRALPERPKGLRMKKRDGSCQVNTSSAAAASSTSYAPASTTSSDADAAAYTPASSSAAAYTPASSSAAADASSTDVNYQANAAYQDPSSAAVSSAAATTTSSAASTATSSSSSSSSNLTPNGKKAGLSAGDSLAAMGDHIGWWYNWAPTEEGTSSSEVQFVPMLWGDGTVDSTDASRLAEFEALTTTPTWIIGFEEPDCSTSGSADMTVAESATLWNNQMVPKGEAGSLLLSPSMCHQAAEDGWLAEFQQQISRDFDILNLHINKNSMDGVNEDLDYYYNKYQKPIWVTEFACVDDSTSFVPCTDQSEINTFIQDIVALFESDSRVYAYGYSNGEGLSDEWAMWSNGALSESGQTYLTAISQYH